VIWLAEEMCLFQWNLILHFKTASGMTHVFEKIKTVLKEISVKNLFSLYEEQVKRWYFVENHEKMFIYSPLKFEEMCLFQWNLILHFKTASGMTHVFEKIKTNNTTRLDQLIVSCSYVLFGRVGSWVIVSL
jgi:hypothetical protein